MSVSGLSNRSMLERRITIPITAIDAKLDETVLGLAKRKYEGKCGEEGYIMPGSLKVATRDAGTVDGSYVSFKLALACDVCFPVEGMTIDCVAKTVTSTAGIRAELDMQPSPLVIYIARDHHVGNEAYKQVVVGSTLKVTVIGQRFEVNDPYISVIAKLLDV